MIFHLLKEDDILFLYINYLKKKLIETVLACLLFKNDTKNAGGERWYLNFIEVTILTWPKWYCSEELCLMQYHVIIILDLYRIFGHIFISQSNKSRRNNIYKCQWPKLSWGYYYQRINTFNLDSLKFLVSFQDYRIEKIIKFVLEIILFIISNFFCVQGPVY